MPSTHCAPYLPFTSVEKKCFITALRDTLQSTLLVKATPYNYIKLIFVPNNRVALNHRKSAYDKGRYDDRDDADNATALTLATAKRNEI